LPQQFARIGVVGAGMMGSEIALVFALAGRSTLLSDRNVALAAGARDRLEGVLARGIPRNFWSREAAEGAVRNLQVVDDLDAHADRDIVIEAVFEDEKIKAEVLRGLEGILNPSAIITSNTSSIPITVLSSFLGEARRKRFVGTHFFSPVSRMALVEVIAGIDTEPVTLDAVSAELVAIGKTPIRVKDVVGFAVNRMLHAFVLEAIRLVEEGACTPRDIDLACKLGLGHPVGPFELLDGVTNSLAQDVHEILYRAYGERFLPRPLLRQLVSAGHIGRKVKRGWYHYDENGKRLSSETS
jgi:3-hydroxybutyryl-CoA dehydrogenase